MSRKCECDAPFQPMCSRCFGWKADPQKEIDALRVEVERLTRDNARLIREQDARIKSHQIERESHLGAYHRARDGEGRLLTENKRLRRVINAARKVWEEACEDVTMTKADEELGAELAGLEEKS